MKWIDLNGQWFVKAINVRKDVPKKYVRILEWIPATVPGTIHTDLLANGIIPDPFYRMNENEVQWIENYQWLYRREFEVDAEFLKERNIILHAEGLDTYASIAVNGKIVGAAENMFVEHRFDLKKHLVAGANTIEIVFDSPVKRSKQLEKKHGALQVALESHRVYVRKAQYLFSWDWGPKLTTSGIWRAISIEASTGPVLRNPFVKTVEVNKKFAVIELSIEIENFQKPISICVKVEGDGFSHEVEKKALSPHLRFDLKIDQPNVWWPNGYGGQPLYTATFTAKQNDDVLSQCSATFGIRTITLVQEKDDEGKSFIIEVNGVKIFCKGADWIPSDNFIPRIPDSTYERLLTMACDAHMNMLRVWGGGIYEQEIFYSLCDKLGLLVWQDFMFACGEYPQTSWFQKLVSDETQKVVTRLRNHPSLAVWCGNNECEWLFCTENPDKTPDDMTGSIIFRELLPTIVKQLDGTRPYWRSSPFGVGFPNNESNGTHHQWHVWSFWKDYKEYENVNARFVSEFGFQAPANIKTWEETTLPEDRFPQHPVIEHHNKQVEGQERLYRFQSAHYNVAADFKEFVYLGQLVQANALKTAVEHWRRRKFKTAGSIFWQLNDCWPVSSWSVIDSSLRPKASYFYARRFFADVLVSIKKNGDTLEVWGTNDRLQRVSGTLHVRVLSFKGEKISNLSKEVVLKSNSSGILQKFYEMPVSDENKYDRYVVAQLVSDEGIISENRFFFTEPKHLLLPLPQLFAKFDAPKDSSLHLIIQSAFFAKDIRIEIDGYDMELSDNYFDLDAGTSRSIVCSSKAKAFDVEKKIKISSLHTIK